MAAEGVILVLLGVAAVVFPMMSGIATGTLFGWILIVAGILGLTGAFGARPQVHFWWSTVSAVLALVAGLVIAFVPVLGVIALIVVIAAWLALDGLASLMLGLHQRRSAAVGGRSWGWLLFSAAADWLLALLLLFVGPVWGIFALGTIVGVALFLGGVALLQLAAAHRKSRSAP